MLTVSQVIPTASSGNAAHAPWSNSRQPITFHDPVLSTISISDDDPAFESSLYTPGETQQRLSEDTTFGHGAAAETLPAGTQLGNFLASLILDDQGNSFIMLFPRRFDAALPDPGLGGRHSVLIFPQARIDPVTGESSFPVFDPAGSYRFDSVRGIANNGRDAQAYPPQDQVPCFTAGTIIETMFGPRGVETLSPGDLIRTRDNGFRWLDWIGSTHLDAARLDLKPNLRPVRIRAGALGPNVPARDLTVSPQHRVLLRSAAARNLFGDTEILAAAKHLVGLPGIEVVRPEAGVTYWHLLFDGHEVVQSNGAWSESLFTGPQAMEAVGPSARREILARFPQLADPDFRPAGARRLLTGRESRRLAQRHARNGRFLVEEPAG
ncbi:Hint domain-containing protein [Paracoccus sp. XHP0099]|uniref:Hint domain-containing protein n=2 Tax=Paracoccus marinaquae TaxID=2841926 RepID=A0ABS6ARY8_9RHOB|nr:Hint domain-containing protein [Paracoccus marinaquae]